MKDKLTFMIVKAHYSVK